MEFNGNASSAGRDKEIGGGGKEVVDGDSQQRSWVVFTRGRGALMSSIFQVFGSTWDYIALNGWWPQ